MQQGQTQFNIIVFTDEGRLSYPPVAKFVYGAGFGWHATFLRLAYHSLDKLQQRGAPLSPAFMKLLVTYRKDGTPPKSDMEQDAPQQDVPQQEVPQDVPQPVLQPPPVLPAPLSPTPSHNSSTYTVGATSDLDAMMEQTAHAAPWRDASSSDTE